MTTTMMFDDTLTDVRVPPRGEGWSRLLRRLLSLLRAERGTGSGGPPGEPPEEPPSAKPAAEPVEMSRLGAAYELASYRPTYEPLALPEPEPTVPPDQPDPPPSGYQSVELDPKGKAPVPAKGRWPFLLLAVLRDLFGDGSSPAA